jgi:hypothetical protein
MTKINKREYSTPMVELLEARVEKGFAGSGSVPQLEDYTQSIGNTETGGYVFN